MKFLTLQVPDSNYEFFKELMNKLNIKTTDDNGMFISEEQKEMVRERIRTAKPEDFMDFDKALDQIEFDEKV
jgi:hypothetical protein